MSNLSFLYTLESSLIQTHYGWIISYATDKQDDSASVANEASNRLPLTSVGSSPLKAH
jgi:hypothetical protein